MEYAGAYRVEGGAATLDALLARLEKDDVITRASPDLFARAFRSFGIDDAHDIRLRAQMRPVAGGRRVFAIFAPSMTSEAQNALLKTIEEPAANALFFIVTPTPETLLPTIRSRTQVLAVASDSTSTIDAKAFLSATPEKRLEMLKPLYEHEGPPASGEGRDIGSVIAFLQSLESQFARSPLSAEAEAGLHAIYRARKYATDKGSLLKALLEQVALLAPKM